jgi:hypothetical protein
MSHAGSHRPACTAAILLLATGSWLIGASTAGADERAPVIRVYDTAASDTGIRTSDIRTAAAIVREAGLSLEWHDCTRAATQPACRNPQRGDLIVRIMPAARTGFTGGTSSPSLRAVPGDEHLQLGVATLDPVTLAGQMATVFHQPVLRIARRARVDPAELLGRTIAHEIGHLLLRTHAHSDAGLMREFWTLEELTSNHRSNWQFAPADRRRLQRQFTSAAARVASNEGEQEAGLQTRRIGSD